MAGTCAATPHINDNNDYGQHSNINTTKPTPLYELQHVFDQYKSQPELLKLILVSKVEEDKRMTEEAKLRSKELDYYLTHDSTPSTTSQNTNSPATIVNQHRQQKMTIFSRSKVNSERPPEPSAPYSTNRHQHPLHTNPTTNTVSSNRIESTDHHQQQRRHSAATAMLVMGSFASPSTTPSLTLTTPTLPDHIYVSDEEMDSSGVVVNNAYPSPVTEHYSMDQEETTGKPRKRREMLAITKIVETRDFPYKDNYFWRNNGNTTQKKTGCRSVYYKCSNSNKGCQVNKTVTAKQNGEYLIKYRGNHMAVCGMVERVHDL